MLQSSYLLILDGRARFEGRSSLKTFLFGVVRRVASHHRRGRLRGLALITRLAAEPATDGSPIDSQDPAMSRALHGLPRRQREVLELVIYAEFTVEESAAILDISIGSARTHFHRAKQALRMALGVLDG